MPKNKTSLKPGDIVRQGRQKRDLRVLQANGDRAVLVETVDAEEGEYETFYTPADTLTLAKAEKPPADPEGEQKPPADPEA